MKINLKIEITEEIDGLKHRKLYDDLSQANIDFRNILTEIKSGRYKGKVSIELVNVKIK